MLIRIVKMGFYKQNVEIFLSDFEKNKKKIRHFEGCKFLELYRDKNTPTIFFTYSYWESEEALDNYRKSELFKEIWTLNKSLFSTPAKAWSLDRMEKIE
ncbi:antibiotic biosynthesis monooxygenase family protein [uncultured Algibacter sp.]|uniref:putative quinol monooxygenase n=1 Tax=uncultured Algibacter sp. TaxID=298659 RepID=UPI003216E39F